MSTTPGEPTGASSSPSPDDALQITWSPALCLRVYLLSGCLALLWASCKMHKLFLLLGADIRGWTTSMLPLLFWDLLVVLLLAFVFCLWLQHTRGFLRGLGQGLFYLLVLVGLLLGVIEHRFFTVTQSLVSWDMLWYGVQQLVMLSDLILSQLNVLTGLFLLLPIGLLWFPTWLGRRERVATWLEGEAGHAWCSPRGIGWTIGLLIMGWILHPPITAHELVPLQRNFMVHWAEGAHTAFNRKTALLPNVAIDRNRLLFDAQRLRFVRTPKTKKPNIVLIVLESMRWRSTTMAQPNLQTTPFLARIAKKSLVVKDMSAVVPHTSKALAAIMCGIYPKVAMEVIEGEVGGIPARCLPSLLKPLGYTSAIFHPATLRFENYDQLSENIGFGLIQGMENFNTLGFFRTNYFGYEDRILLKPSLKWVDKTLATKKPFFLAYHTLTSHHEYKTPPSFPMQTYTTKSKALNQYLNALRYTDDFLAELFKAFEKRKMMENTVFLFVADHGEAFGEHKRYQHDNGMWQEILKIPMLIYAPSRWPKGGVIEGPRQQIDIVPTIADIMQVKIKSGRLPGKSMLQPVSPHRRLMMSCWYERFCMAMREGSKKFIYHYGKHPDELYELKNDHKERQNLALLPAHKPQVVAVKKALLTWRAQVNHVYDTPDPYRLQKSIQKQAPAVDVSMRVQFGPYLELVGYRLGKGPLRPGGVVDLVYVFRCVRKIPAGWQLFYHLLAENPPRFMNKDHSPVAGRFPLQKWVPGQYILDRHRFRLPLDYAPGSKVSLRLGLWSAKAEKRATLQASPGGYVLQAADTKESALHLRLGVLSPPKRLAGGRPPVAKPRNARLGGMARFVGYNLHSPKLTPGTSLDITLVFQALREIPKGWRLFFHVEQNKPRQFLNAEDAQKLPNISTWKPHEYITLRLRVPLSKAFFKRGAALRLWTGIWAPAKPRRRVFCDDKDQCSDGKGRLLVMLRMIGRK